ncbi:MAG: hypothetical protein ACRD6W_11110, partial [Nitrososphaerales archaeon]
LLHRTRAAIRRRQRRHQTAVVGGVLALGVVVAAVALPLTALRSQPVSHTSTRHHPGNPPKPLGGTPKSSVVETTSPPSTTSPTTTVASTTTTSISPQPSTTQTDHYSPWTSSGSLAPSIKTLGTLTGGNCWTGSLADGPNDYAWRCMDGNDIYDPCFASPGATNVTQVACAANPWSGVYLMDLSSPLASASTGGSADWPWYIVLSNGAQCGKFDAAGPPVVDGVSLAYECGNNGAASMPDRSTNPWTVQYGPHDAGPLRSLTVTQAWE